MFTITPRDRSGITAPQVRRLSGLALLAAFPLQVVGFALHPAGEQLEHVRQTIYGPAHLLIFFSWLLVLLGLPVLYAMQAGRAGRLGLAGYVGTIAAAAYHLYLTLYEATVMPLAADLPDAANLVGDGQPFAHGAGALGPVAAVLMLAFPVLGWATLRAGVFPKSVGWLQLAAVPVFVTFMIGIGVVTSGAVGPEAEGWIGGMLPITSLYVVLFAGYALGGLALRRRDAGDAGSERADRPVSAQPA